MNRYLLFTYDNYYPGGGINDFKSAFPTIEAAKAEIPQDYKELAQIVYIDDDGTLKEVCHWCTWAYNPEESMVSGWWI